MPTPMVLKLVIELEPGELVAGWMRQERGPRRHFEGLLHLISLLEEARLARWPPSSQDGTKAGADP